MTHLSTSTAPNSTNATRPSFGRPSNSDVTVLLRAEGAAALVAALAAYAALGGSWTFFAVLLLLPDVAMVGYAAGPKAGARLYNAAHTYLAPGLLAGVGVGLDLPLLLTLACIWVAHIGMDRAMGYGLKRDTGFSDTHLGSVGLRQKTDAHLWR